MASWTLYAYFLFLFCVTSAALLFFFYKVLYKVRVCIREIANNRKVVKVWAARNYIDKEGSPYWRLLGERNKIKRNLPVPPNDVIEITPKGRFFAECYRWSDGSISWIKDSNQVKDPPVDMFDNISQEDIDALIKKELPKNIAKLTDENDKAIKTKEWVSERIKQLKLLAIQQWKKDNHVVEAFQPVTTNQRQILISIYAKAAQRKTKSTMDKVMQYVPLGGLIIIIIVGMLVWKDLAKPVLDARDQELQSQKIQQESLKIIRDIDNRVQTIESQQIQVKQVVNSNKSNEKG